MQPLDLCTYYTVYHFKLYYHTFQRTILSCSEFRPLSYLTPSLISTTFSSNIGNMEPAIDNGAAEFQNGATDPTNPASDPTTWIDYAEDRLVYTRICNVGLCDNAGFCNTDAMAKLVKILQSSTDLLYCPKPYLSSFFFKSGKPTKLQNMTNVMTVLTMCLFRKVYVSSLPFAARDGECKLINSFRTF